MSLVIECMQTWERLREEMSPETVMRTDEPMASKTTLRVGGKAKYYIEPAQVEDFQKALKFAKNQCLEIFVLGRGSNIIVLDSGFDGVVIHFKHSNWKRIEEIDENRFYAGAGVRLKEVCGYAAKMGLAGFEFLEGIPGSLGGSLRMNAGAMGGWLFDVVESVCFMTRAGELFEAPKNEFNLGYRHCKELQEAYALGATLKGSEKLPEESIRQKIMKNSVSRKASQPREPSAGCIFKNPEGNFSGRLIDSAGLKGASEGKAQVSEIHGNFIINKGGASSDDVIALVNRVRNTVFEKSGILLEPEVLLLGAKWQDILKK